MQRRLLGETIAAAARDPRDHKIASVPSMALRRRYLDPMSQSGGETLIRVRVGMRANRTPIYETLWVDGRPDGLYRLVKTPLLAVGIARDDIFRVHGDGIITEVVENGSYRAIQLISARPLTGPMLAELASLAVSLGSNLDAHDDLMVGMAVPKSVPIVDLRAVIGRYSKRYPLEKWWQGDTAPLSMNLGE